MHLFKEIVTCRSSALQSTRATAMATAKSPLTKTTTRRRRRRREERRARKEDRSRGPKTNNKDLVASKLIFSLMYFFGPDFLFEQDETALTVPQI